MDGEFFRLMVTFCFKYGYQQPPMQPYGQPFMGQPGFPQQAPYGQPQFQQQQFGQPFPQPPIQQQQQQQQQFR